MPGVLPFAPALLQACEPRELAQVEAEVALLKRHYLPDCDPRTLEAAAEALEASLAAFPVGRRRLHLWAALLRKSAAATGADGVAARAADPAAGPVPEA